MSHFRQGIKNIPEICARYAVNKVVIAPGSRNAPLIFAFTAQLEMECLSITDERSAAYFALGIALQSGEAVALVCTSGTAVLNFAPAIAEAYYQNLPLLVFTADRPAEMIDQADGQTLQQTNIYGNYIKASFDLPLETLTNIDLQFCDRQVSQAINTAVLYPKGPVQINVPLREPIYTALPETHSNPKIIKTIDTKTFPTNESIKMLKEVWTSYKRKMVVIGVFSKNDELNQLANLLASEPEMVVLCENLSNVSGENIISQPESLFARLNSVESNDIFAPELLITIGQSVICKQLKIFLRNHKLVDQWQFESSLPFIDTYKSLTTIVPGSASEILKEMPFGKTESNFSETYKREFEIVQQLHDSFLSTPKSSDSGLLSDMNAVSALLELMPKNTILHLANSTSVRWTQLFPMRPDVKYFCNRGTSGIDGSLSTAAGFAFASKQPTVFLTGDLSFIYDSNGLWNNYIGDNLKIVLMNNNGGNIFSFIGDKDLMKDSFDFFTTPHHVNIKSMVEAYGLNYMVCDKTELLDDCIINLFQSDKATVLEIFTDSDLNTENYKGYFKNIKTPNP
ncbi:MAG: 2-succinyl-5-enolpyruvyl-6-hydroxy-3-cyclohexene-1-carboxylic-acid synthase [Paludibacter sp.]|nr:2-succinyl-5-enolpyruvyl-6-hydroxy-3-cyclohexene-1-carboxylic-acid synthase [Paludibacter sp.]